MDVNHMTPNRRDLLHIAGMFGALPLAAAAADSPHPLTGAIVDEKAAAIHPYPWGEHRLYFQGTTANGRTASAGSVWVKPGMEPHPPHQHPEEEFMVVTEGSGEISVEGKVTKVGPGSMMYCAAGKLHGIRNTGKGPLLFYFYKWKA